MASTRTAYHLDMTLEAAGWVIDGPRGAARTLGLHPSTLRNRMRKLGIRHPRWAGAARQLA